MPETKFIETEILLAALEAVESRRGFESEAELRMREKLQGMYRGERHLLWKACRLVAMWIDLMVDVPGGG